MLAADQERPQKLETNGLAVDGSRFTYARGKLVIWSADPGKILATPAATLQSSTVRKIALANPALAPYGSAGRTVLQQLGLADALRNRIVLGENIGQAFTLAATGNADLVLAAGSQLQSEQAAAGASIEVPVSVYPAILQDAVLLRSAANNEAAIAFMKFLAGSRAQRMIESHGYLENDGA